MKYPIDILGIDGSTDITGVALVRFDATGKPDVLHCTSFDAPAILKAKAATISRDSLTARFQRIRAIKMAFHLWNYEAFTLLKPGPDVVAYERGFYKGDAPTQCSYQSGGAYVSMARFKDARVIQVSTVQVKDCWKGGATARRRNVSREAKEEKKAISKYQGVEWARQELGLCHLLDTDDAISDACGVAVAAYRLLLKSESAPKTPARGKGVAR